MDSLKNLAGNDVSIFLFRFDVHGNAIDFILNQAIAADSSPYTFFLLNGDMELNRN